MGNKNDSFILGLDVSTKTIGVALFKNNGELVVLKHVTPKLKPIPETKIEELFQKVDLFKEGILDQFKLEGYDISRIIIEEPLLRSNNVNTIATLLRFNGMIAKACYDMYDIVPDFISVNDARKYGFPELMDIRTHDKKGQRYTEKVIQKKIDDDAKTLFGAYPWDVDKKTVIWEKVSQLEPEIKWELNRNNKLRNENFDMADAYACVVGFMRKFDYWTIDEKKSIKQINGVI